MDNTLPKLKSLIENLNASNSSIAKQEVLRGVTDPDLLLLIQEIHHPRKVFGITSKGVMKVGGLADHPDTLLEMLEMLANREVTGNAAAQMVNGFIHDNGYEYQDLILNAIDKDLKTRVGVTLYNKVFGDMFIPEFKVALCDVYAECSESVDFENDEWLASRKLDGCVSGDTLISVEDGKILPIKTIVENKLDVKVLTYNTETDCKEYKPIKNYMKNLDDINESSYQWFELELEDGRKLKVTGNHKIYLPELQCWRRVDELTENDMLYVI